MNQTGGEPSAPDDAMNAEPVKEALTTTDAKPGASNPAANVRAECLPECSVCKWTNSLTALWNLGEPGRAVWVCQGCVKRHWDERHTSPKPETQPASEWRVEPTACGNWVIIAENIGLFVLKDYKPMADNLATLHNTQVANITAERDELKEENESFADDIRAYTKHIATLTAERDHWIKSHDNQVKLKAALLDRPDLKERAELVQKLIAERDELRDQINTLESFLMGQGWMDNPSKRPVGRIIWKVEELMKERDELKARLEGQTQPKGMMTDVGKPQTTAIKLEAKTPTPPTDHAREAAEKIRDYFDVSKIFVEDVERLIQSAIDKATAELSSDRESLCNALDARTRERDQLKEELQVAQRDAAGWRNACIREQSHKGEIARDLDKLCEDNDRLRKELKEATSFIPEGYRTAKDNLPERVQLMRDGLYAFQSERETLRADNDRLQKELDEKQKALDNSARDWADNDTRVKEIAKTVLGDSLIESDAAGFVGVIGVAEQLVERIKAQRKELEEVKEHNERVKKLAGEDCTFLSQERQQLRDRITALEKDRERLSWLGNPLHRLAEIRTLAPAENSKWRFSVSVAATGQYANGEDLRTALDAIMEGGKE